MWNNQNNKKLFSFMSNLQNYHFKLDFHKVDQHQKRQGQSVAKPGTPCRIS